ncbi:hypothetical protein [Novosphingobium resinovorum]|nr:hypothetical protein [Novosphingobium resinovorum]
MARIVSLVHTPTLAQGADRLRALVVCGCALALILARDVLPF